MKKGQAILFAVLLLILVGVAITMFSPQIMSPQKPFEYIVSEGDTCAQISSTFKVSIVDIIQENGLTPECKLIVGQVLYIPAP